jgi:DNA recombination protein RmuC
MNEWSLIAAVVGSIIVILLGVNLYLTLKARKQGSGDQYLVLHQRLDSFSKLINDQLESNRQSAMQATLSVHQQVQNFTQGMTQLQETVKQVQASVQSVSSFQDIFKSPKLRGIWGEASLEAALGQYFSRDLYGIQHYFKSGEAVDAVLKLPNDLLLPIDSKFNWENFEKMVNAESKTNEEIYRKQFFIDVKKKIDEIATKYILPSESTTDLALMYIPAETVYYELINSIKDVDIPAYARSKKVYLVSPNTLALSISAIMHWFRDVEVTKRTGDIIKRLERIAQDGTKLGDDFRRLGKHISDARSSYDDTEKRLSLMVGRVQTVIRAGSLEDDPKEIDIPKA